MSTARTTELTLSARANGYVALTKPDVSLLVLMTTAAGYYMGARGPVGWLHMLHAVFGTMLIAAGTAALNHYIQHDTKDQRFPWLCGRCQAACCSHGKRWSLVSCWQLPGPWTCMWRRARLLQDSAWQPA